METREITNGEDIIDSRDIIERIDYLDTNYNDLDDVEKLELVKLRKVAEQAEGYGDWEYGEGLIRDSYFETYAQELAEDTGAISRDANWPLNKIDWEAAADELKIDYMEVEFDGVSYWIRV